MLVLLGLTAAFVLPSLRLPSRTADAETALVRARAIAVRRGESVRLQADAGGAWTVRATADTTGAILLAGSGDAGIVHPVVISALGTCLPEGTVAVGVRAWDPVRCAEARH